MKKILYVILFGVLLFASCDKESGKPEVESPMGEVYEDEGTVILPGGEKDASTRVAVTSGAEYLSAFNSTWVVGDILLFVFEQTLNGVTTVKPQWSGGKTRTIISVDPNNPAKGDFTWGVPVGIDRFKPYELYVFYGVDEVTVDNNVPSVRLPGVKEFKNYQMGTRNETLRPPVRSLKTTVYPMGTPERPSGTKPVFNFEHIGAMQVVEIENISDKETSGTFRFDLQNEPTDGWGRWYYPKEITYNPITGEVAPDYKTNPIDISDSETITIPAGEKGYLLNWINVKRSDDVLSYLETMADNTLEVPNPAKRPAVNMVYTPTGGEAALAQSSELGERIKPLHPSRVYYYRFKWDGKNLILVSDWEVLPWETVQNEIDLTDY